MRGVSQQNNTVSIMVWGSLDVRNRARRSVARKFGRASGAHLDAHQSAARIAPEVADEHGLADEVQYVWEVRAEPIYDILPLSRRRGVISGTSCK